MAELFKSEPVVRDYLLGRITDEEKLEQIEELMFVDEDFCAHVELVEDDIINDYVLGKLNAADSESFTATLRNDSERRFKVDLTRGLKERARIQDVEVRAPGSSWLESVTDFFRRPAYAGAFALLLIAVVAVAIFLMRRGRTDDLAELRSIYSQSRPTETRISTFNYAPFTQLRGAPDSREQNRLRKIENNLISKTEQSPGADTHHELGIFYLTQHKPREGIKELEAALTFNDKDARIHNDLGSAHFELAQTGPRENKLEELAKSLEHFTRATALDPNLLEALFNKSLALQEMKLPREARQSWTLYLQKDSSSPWAEEARRKLAAIKDESSLFKSDADVLSDFLAAFRQHDDDRAEQIHNETKGLLRGASVSIQLSRRFLQAKTAGNESAGQESLQALTFIGNFEQTKHHDSFFLSRRTFIRAWEPARLLFCSRLVTA